MPLIESQGLISIGFNRLFPLAPGLERKKDNIP
jgi:hypothetical protein